MSEAATELELHIMLALADKPLSEHDLVESLSDKPEKDVKSAIYKLSTQDYMITKQPIISGGCRDCGCQVHYAWRLTFKGRETITTGEAT